jgi:hypothetical protein
MTAEDLSTPPDPSFESSLVARPHLAQLDPGSISPGQVPQQQTEVDPMWSGEVDAELRTVQGVLRRDKVHRQVMVRDHLARRGEDPLRIRLIMGVRIEI